MAKRRVVSQNGAEDAPTPRTPASSTSSQADAAAATLREDLIREAAYFRAERREFAPGGELEDWLEAEYEIDRRIETRDAPMIAEQTQRRLRAALKFREARKSQHWR
ncbi:MAG: DUF2934 domain-containing protein [Steroidobacteraceae bacterium]